MLRNAVSRQSGAFTLTVTFTVTLTLLRSVDEGFCLRFSSLPCSMSSLALAHFFVLHVVDTL